MSEAAMGETATGGVVLGEMAADAPFTVTDRAFKRVAEILANEDASALRVAVEGGGCSGFQYTYDLVDGATDEDLVLSGGNATVVVDPVSLPFLAGAELDFVDDLMGRAFQINNPNAQASCGCGTSFSLL